MGKLFLKSLAMMTLTVISLSAAVIVYLCYFLDLEQYKPVIINYVEAQYQRQLTIDGEIDISLYPIMGLQIAEVKLSQPELLKEKLPVQAQENAFLEVAQLIAEVELLPLLAKELKIKQIQLEAVQVNYFEYQSNLNSLFGLISNNTQQKPEKNNEQSTTLEIELAQLTFSDIQFNYYPPFSKSPHLLLIEQLHLSDLAANQTANIELLMSYVQRQPAEVKAQLELRSSLLFKDQQITLPDLTVQLNTQLPEPNSSNKVLSFPSEFKAALTLDLAQQQLKLAQFSLAVDAQKSDGLQGKGELMLQWARQPMKLSGEFALAALFIDKVDVINKLLISQSPTSASTTSTAQPKLVTQNDDAVMSEPDLSFLNQFDVDLKLTTEQIQWQQLQLDALSMELQVAQGKLTIKEFLLALYQGQVTGEFALNAQQAMAEYQFSQTIQGLQIQPLFASLMDSNLIAGTFNAQVQGQGASLISEKLLSNLVADGQFHFADGALYGVNIPLMIREFKQKLQGQHSTTQGALKTDFSSLEGSFQLRDGQLYNDDLLLLSPLMTLQGQGQLDLPQQQLDYRLQSSLVASLVGQGRESDQKQLSIPLQISGDLTSPTIALDVQQLAQSELQHEFEQQKQLLEDKLKEDVKEKLEEKLLEKLGSFL